MPAPWLRKRKSDPDFGSGVWGRYVMCHGQEGNCGMILSHRRADRPSRRHGSFLAFDVPAAAGITDRPKWQVGGVGPLTLTPSVLCDPAKGGCGLHGWITNGVWHA